MRQSSAERASQDFCEIVARIVGRAPGRGLVQNQQADLDRVIYFSSASTGGFLATLARCWGQPSRHWPNESSQAYALSTVGRECRLRSTTNPMNLAEDGARPIPRVVVGAQRQRNCPLMVWRWNSRRTTTPTRTGWRVCAGINSEDAKRTAGPRWRSGQNGQAFLAVVPDRGQTSPRPRPSDLARIRRPSRAGPNRMAALDRSI